MIEGIVEDFIVVPSTAKVADVCKHPRAYTVIVDKNQAPVALTTMDDLAALPGAGEKPLVQVISRLPEALVAGRGINIESLAKAVNDRPAMLKHGTVLMNAKGVVGIHPVHQLLNYMRAQGPRFSGTIANIDAAAVVGAADRGRILPGRGKRRCIWVVCARCGTLNCLKYIPAKGELMPTCEKKDPPHRVEMNR